MQTTRTTGMPITFRPISIIFALIIAFGSALVTTSPAFANGPTPPDLVQRQQIESQLQHARNALILKSQTVDLDRSQLASLDKNLRLAIEQFANDVNAGKIGFALIDKDNLKIYGNRSQILRQLQHLNQTNATGLGRNLPKTNAVYSDQYGLYVSLDSFWTRVLKSGYRKYTTSVAHSCASVDL